jgi:type II secretory pathway component GspD/PulD (secretin)
MTKQYREWGTRRCRAAAALACLLCLFVVCFYLQLPAKGQGYTNTFVPMRPAATAKQRQIAVNNSGAVVNDQLTNTPAFGPALDSSRTAFVDNRATPEAFHRLSSQPAQNSSWQQAAARHPERSVAGTGSWTSGRPAYGVQQASYQMPPNQSHPQGFLVPPQPGNAPLTKPIFSTTPQRLPPGPSLRSGEFAFNFSNAPWELVLKQFAYQNGMSLQITQPATGTFTYFDEKRYSTSQALDILNDYLLPQGSILVRQSDKLTLLGADSSIPDGLIPFVQIRQLPEIGRNELATIAIPMRISDPASAVSEIEQLLSRVGRAQSLSNSNRVMITDTGAYLRRIFDLVTGAGVAAAESQSFVYELRHSAAEEVANAINQFYASKGPEAGGRPAHHAGGQSSQVVVAEKTTNSLLVHGRVNDASEIYSMIQQLDRAPREVVIQAVLVEVQLGNTDEFGVELGFQDSVLFNRSVIDNILTVTETVTSPNGTQTSNDRIISQTAAPGFNFNNQPLGNNVAISPSTVAGQALSSFGTGRVNGDLGFGGLVLSAGSESVSVLLRALSAKFEIDILSRPQIRALDNHEALIQIGQQVPVVDGVSVTAVGSANPVIRQDQAGIILKVTPRISPEARVMIQVSAEKSSFQLAPGTGVPIFTDATNGNVIEAPVKDITTANTAVSVQSGQTIVLGGMITKEDITVERKVPFLGDIPIIGRAFRYDLEQSERRELLIFLTPYVVENQAHSEEMKHREIQHVHMPKSTKEFDWQLYGGSSYQPCREPGCQTDGTVSADRFPVPGQVPFSGSTGPSGTSGNSVMPVGHSQQAALNHQPVQVAPPASAASQTNGWKPFSTFRGNANTPRKPKNTDPPRNTGMPLQSGYSDIGGQQATPATEPFQIYLPPSRR